MAMHKKLISFCLWVVFLTGSVVRQLIRDWPLTLERNAPFFLGDRNLANSILEPSKERGLLRPLAIQYLDFHVSSVFSLVSLSCWFSPGYKYKLPFCLHRGERARICQEGKEICECRCLMQVFSRTVHLLKQTEHDLSLLTSVSFPQIFTEWLVCYRCYHPLRIKWWIRTNVELMEKETLIMTKTSAKKEKEEVRNPEITAIITITTNSLLSLYCWSVYWDLT